MPVDVGGVKHVGVALDGFALISCPAEVLPAVRLQGAEIHADGEIRPIVHGKGIVAVGVALALFLYGAVRRGDVLTGADVHPRAVLGISVLHKANSLAVQGELAAQNRVGVVHVLI